MHYSAIVISLAAVLVAGLVDTGRSRVAEQEANPAVSLAATEPLAVVETWIAGHRIARHDVNLLAADAVLEVAGAPPLTGAAEIVAFVDAFYGAIGDREVTVEASVASGDEVAGLLRVRGTHAGPLLGVPATGNPVDFLLTAFVEVRDGEIVRIRAVFDAAGLLTQIGALPSPGKPAARFDIGPRDVTV